MIKLTGVFGISSFRFFRFNMILHEPCRFYLINIGEMYSLVLCPRSVITSFAKSF